MPLALSGAVHSLKTSVRNDIIMATISQESRVFAYSNSVFCVCGGF